MGTECTAKYGKVTGVVIFEVTQPGFPPELAVRIFVAFERQEDATKVRWVNSFGCALVLTHSQPQACP